MVLLYFEIKIQFYWMVKLVSQVFKGKKDGFNIVKYSDYIAATTSNHKCNVG